MDIQTMALGVIVVGTLGWLAFITVSKERTH